MKFKKINTTESSEFMKSIAGKHADMPVPRIVIDFCLSQANTLAAYLIEDNSNHRFIIATSVFNGDDVNFGTTKVLDAVSKRLSARTDLPDTMPYRFSS